jgi:hypothetical protein
VVTPICSFALVTIARIDGDPISEAVGASTTGDGRALKCCLPLPLQAVRQTANSIEVNVM